MTAHEHSQDVVDRWFDGITRAWCAGCRTWLPYVEKVTRSALPEPESADTGESRRVVRTTGTPRPLSASDSRAEGEAR